MPKVSTYPLATPAAGDSVLGIKGGATVRFDAGSASAAIFLTVADLAASTQNISTAQTLGYYAAGDGGGGDYRLGTGAETEDFGLVISGAGGRKWLLVHSGDVRCTQFGVMPDGVTNWELTQSARYSAMLLAAKQVKMIFPAGYYATGLNLDSRHSGSRHHMEPGSLFGGVLHYRGYETANVAISSLTRAGGVVTLVASSAHGLTSGMEGRVRGQTAASALSFEGRNLAVTVIDPTTLTYPQAGPDETISSGCGWIKRQPLRDVVVTGDLATSDRFGPVNIEDSRFEVVRVVKDLNRHIAYPGTTCRGAHMYGGGDNCSIEKLIIEDAAGANTDAALAMDGYGDSPRGWRIGRCTILDSAYHGAYITGDSHRIEELEILGYGRLNDYVGTLQDSDGAAQSAIICGLWTNRISRASIGKLRVSQRLTDGRPNTGRHLRIDETALSSEAATARTGIYIGEALLENLNGAGACIGDPAYLGPNCHAQIGVLTIRPRTGVNLGSTVYALDIAGGTGVSSINIEVLRLLGFGANNNGVLVRSTGTALIGRIETDAAVRQLVHNNGGRLTVESILHRPDATADASGLVEISNATGARTRIGTYEVLAPGGMWYSRALVANAGASDWSIGLLATDGIRQATALAQINNGCARWSIDSIALRMPAATGPCLNIRGTQTDGYIGRGIITGGSLGIKGDQTPAFTRVRAVGLSVTGNTVQTDIAAGQIENVASVGVTL